MKIALVMGPRPEAGCGVGEYVGLLTRGLRRLFSGNFMAQSHLKIYQQMGGFSYANRD